MAWNSVKEKKGETKSGSSSKVVELRSEGSAEKADADKNKDETAKGKGENLQGGMELLEQDFLLDIIESTSGNDKNDVTMRKLTFNEMLRREKQDQIDSKALKVYAVNSGNLYGKDIQCEAMKELSRRTAEHSK